MNKKLNYSLLFSIFLALLTVACGNDNKSKKKDENNNYNRYQTLNNNEATCSNYYDSATGECSPSGESYTSGSRDYYDSPEYNRYQSSNQPVNYYDNAGSQYPYYNNYNGSGYPYYPQPYDPRYMTQGGLYHQPGYYPSYGGGNFPFVCNYGTMCGFDPNIGRMPGPVPPYPYGSTPYVSYYNQCTSDYGGHCGNGQFYSGYLYHHGYASCHPSYGFCYPKTIGVEFNNTMYVPIF